MLVHEDVVVRDHASASAVDQKFSGVRNNEYTDWKNRTNMTQLPVKMRTLRITKQRSWLPQYLRIHIDPKSHQPVVQAHTNSSNINNKRDAVIYELVSVLAHISDPPSRDSALNMINGEHLTSHVRNCQCLCVYVLTYMCCVCMCLVCRYAFLPTTFNIHSLTEQDGIYSMTLSYRDHQVVRNTSHTHTIRAHIAHTYIIMRMLICISYFHTIQLRSRVCQFLVLMETAMYIILQAQRL